MFGYFEALARLAANASPIEQGVVIFLLTATWLFLRQWRQASQKSVLQVAQLWVYPIKSCAGVQLTAAACERGGLQWDRAFAIIKPDGEVLSQV